MILQDLMYHRPGTLSEALECAQSLADKGMNFRFLSGGTDLIPNIKRGLSDQEIHVIALSGMRELSNISEENGLIKIGALCTLADIIDHAILQRNIPSLAETVAKIANPQIRNRATLGGNLLADTRCVFFNQTETIVDSDGACYKNGGDVCHLIPNASHLAHKPCRARFVSDAATILILADTQLEIRSIKGGRKVALRDFYSADGIAKNCLQRQEILVGIEFKVADYQRMSYEKLRLRSTFDFASVGVGVYEDGATLHFSVNGVESYPVYKSYDLPATTVAPSTSDLSQWLKGVCDDLAKNCSPLRQDLLSPSYRKQMIAVLAKRAALKKSAIFLQK